MLIVGATINDQMDTYVVIFVGNSPALMISIVGLPFSVLCEGNGLVL